MTFYRKYTADVYVYALGVCGAASVFLLRPHNMHKSLVVSSQDGEGQLAYSRESSAQVEEMTRAWQEVSGAGSLLHSPSLATLAATPASGKPAYTHTHVRALPFNRGRSHAACPSETEKTLLWVLFLFFIRQNFSDKINK